MSITLDDTKLINDRINGYLQITKLIDLISEHN